MHAVTNTPQKIGLTCDFFHAYQKIVTIRIQSNTRAMLTPATRRAKRRHDSKTLRQGKN